MRRRTIALGVGLALCLFAGTWIIARPHNQGDGELNLANAALNRGNLSEALEKYRQVVVASPNHAAAYAGLGNTYLMMGDHDRAVQALESAISFDPNRPHVFCQLADAYVQLRERDAGQRASAEALRRDPNCAHAHFVAGEQALRDDDLNHALAEFQKAMALEPDLLPAYQRAGYTLRELGKPDEAEAVLLQGLKRGPNRIDIHLQLANIYAVRTHDPASLQKAEAHFRQALQGNPQPSEVQAGLGTLAHRAGNHSEARRWWEQAIESNRNQATALYGLSDLKRSSGETKAAEELLARYKRVSAFQREITTLRTQTKIRKDKKLRLRLARLALEAGYLDEAERQLANLQREQPSDPAVRTLHGELYLAQNAPEKARQEFQVAGTLAQFRTE